MLDMSKVKELIEKHPHEIHKLQDVAEKLDCSCETLRKEFLRKEGVHFSEYLISVRVSKMKELLSLTNKLCFEICFEAGFMREDSAARIFKRVVGLTMVEYRKQQKQMS